jgi:hypothetical protein
VLSPAAKASGGLGDGKTDDGPAGLQLPSATRQVTPAGTALDGTGTAKYNRGRQTKPDMLPSCFSPSL